MHFENALSSVLSSNHHDLKMSQVSHMTVPSSGVVLVQASSNIENTSEILPLLVTNSYEIPKATIGNLGPHSLLRITDIAAPQSGYIRIIELNNPSTRNALSRALLAELRREVDTIRKQYEPHTGQEVPMKLLESDACTRQNGPTRALIIASALDSSFCSGADLKERKGFTLEE